MLYHCNNSPGLQTTRGLPWKPGGHEQSALRFSALHWALSPHGLPCKQGFLQILSWPHDLPVKQNKNNENVCFTLIGE